MRDRLVKNGHTCSKQGSYKYIWNCSSMHCDGVRWLFADMNVSHTTPGKSCSTVILHSGSQGFLIDSSHVPFRGPHFKQRTPDLWGLPKGARFFWKLGTLEASRASSRSFVVFGQLRRAFSSSLVKGYWGSRQELPIHFTTTISGLQKRRIKDARWPPQSLALQQTQLQSKISQTLRRRFVDLSYGGFPCAS